jgi:MFS family permease
MRSASILYFIDGICFGMLLPLLPFVVLDAGGSPSLVTQLVAAFAIAGLVGRFLAGRLSDRWGRVDIILWSLLCSTLAYAALTLWFMLLPLLFVFRIVVGLMAGREPVVQTLATDGLAPSEHVRVIGAITSAYAVGAALGPGVSSVLSLLVDPQLDHYRLVFAAATTLSFVSLVVVLLSLRSAEPPRTGSRQATVAVGRGLAMRQFRGMFLLNFLAALAYAPIISVTALYSNAAFGWSATEVGWLLVAVAIGIVLARVVLIPVGVKEFGDRKVLIACAAIAAAALLLAGRANGAAGFSFALIAASVAASGLNILALANVSRDCPLPHRGSVLGAAQACYGGGLFLGAAANGPLFEFVGRSVPFEVAAAVALLIFALAITGWFRIGAGAKMAGA